MDIKDWTGHVCADTTSCHVAAALPFIAAKVNADFNSLLSCKQ